MGETAEEDVSKTGGVASDNIDQVVSTAALNIAAIAQVLPLLILLPSPYSIIV